MVSFFKIKLDVFVGVKLSYKRLEIKRIKLQKACSRFTTFLRAYNGIEVRV